MDYVLGEITTEKAEFDGGSQHFCNGNCFNPIERMHFVLTQHLQRRDIFITSSVYSTSLVLRIMYR